MYYNLKIFIFHLLLLIILHTKGIHAEKENYRNGTSPLLPRYRFRYYVRDDKTGDYKTQEERRNGNNVKGTYTVAEPNGDLRVVKYTADTDNGFRADVNIQSGASPILPVTQRSLIQQLQPYSNYRTGFSGPQKPMRGFNSPVNSEIHPQLTDEYPYYEKSPDKQQDLVLNDTEESTTTSKSVQVELNYKDESVSELVRGKEDQGDKEVHIESTTTVNTKNQNDSEIKPVTLETDNKESDRIVFSKPVIEEPSVSESPSSTSKAMFQFPNMEIPISVMDIINKNNFDFNNVMQQNFPNKETTPIASTTVIRSTTTSTTKTVPEPYFNDHIDVPLRPMRLVGLNPYLLNNYQFQSFNNPPSTIPTLNFEPIPTVQYLPPMFSALNGAKNSPRSVLNATIPIEYKPAPSIPITAPIISPNQYIIPYSDKPENPLPFCNNCILPQSYLPPAVKPHMANSKCQNHDHEFVLYWNSVPLQYKTGLAFIVMPPSPPPLNKNQL